MILRHTARTDIGNWREKNEDAFVVSEELGLYAVADGMGGHVGGGVASQVSLKALEDVMRQMSKEEPSADWETTQRQPFLKRLTKALAKTPRDPRQETLKRAMQLANHTVIKFAEEHPIYRGMGTTLTALWIDPKEEVNPAAYIGNIGDSRTYLLREGELRQMTEDHSWVHEQVRAGRLSAQEADYHHLKNVVTRAVGLEANVEADVFRIELREGDRYLLCSDGLTNMLRADEILEILKREQVEEVADELVEKSKVVGGLDNITLILVDVARL
ncbi:MAG: Stp1/IreP family PP2C-type Ser/Thr phosphatase [Nitrospirae bacterium]|nr:Stp1/IreP family PP2C-type Ser/Thr phosphatase [Nitrospirota bacterium]